jgi:galactokinase
VTVQSVALATSGTATHGKTFKVTRLTVDLSNGVETKATSLKCTATLGGKHLAGTGVGGCTFHLPATAKGKKLSVKVTGKYKTKALAKAASFKVK